jgi:hypothetical protein
MRPRLVVLLSVLAISGCAGQPADPEPAVGAVAQPLFFDHVGSCWHPPEVIEEAFVTFDAQTSPPAAGQPASVVLAPWLAHLSQNVKFEVGNDPVRVGRAAVADYFDPLLPVLGSVVHDIETVSPICEEDHAWSVRGDLLLTRKSDGQPIQPIRFTDALFLNHDEDRILRYEVRFDPTPLGQLFVP